MIPAPRTKPRRNETRELVMPIMAAVNAIPGVRVWRPHVLATRERSLSGAGLANGSADLIGLVIGRFFALEVKWPGKKPNEDQLIWMATVRTLGGFACIVHSEGEAFEAVARCRRGYSE